MSTTLGKRKRVRKACIPCHARKRKCDSKYPCNMCVTYEYSCSYADNQRDRFGSSTQPAATTQAPNPVPHPAKRVYIEPDQSTSNGTDGHRFRYSGPSAAMAFPHVVSKALGAEDLSNSGVKMHSFAYNFGIRPHEAAKTHGYLGDYITDKDLAHFADIYFAAIGASIGDVVDPRIFAQRCRTHFYEPDNSTLAFGAVAAGIAALGSFLSPIRHSRESELVQYAKSILEDPTTICMVEIDHIIAAGLRVIYLRATTRPSNAWMASCAQMHFCEALGLHQEDNVKKIASAAGAAALGQDADRLRRIFWISWSGHQLLSYEYDRSAVQFRSITTQPIKPISGSIAHQFVQIAQIIPAANSPFQLAQDFRTPTEELLERLKATDELQTNDPFLLVTKADLAFCYYRRAYQFRMGIPDELVQLVIKIGNEAMKAAEQLAQQGRFFWNVIGSAFHYACTLLAIDTPAASACIPAAFKNLEALVSAADTGHTREAMAVAQYLLDLYMSRKRKELADLESAQANNHTLPTQAVGNATTVDMPELGYGLDWDQLLLEPYLSIFGGDVQR